jgi:hypothetical protein
MLCKSEHHKKATIQRNQNNTETKLKKRWIRQQESRVKISGNFGTKPSIRGAYDRAGLSSAAARSPTARLAEGGTIEGGVFHLDPRMGWVAGVERTEETRFNDLGEEREHNELLLPACILHSPGPSHVDVPSPYGGTIRTTVFYFVFVEKWTLAHITRQNKRSRYHPTCSSSSISPHSRKTCCCAHHTLRLGFPTTWP